MTRQIKPAIFYSIVFVAILLNALTLFLFAPKANANPSQIMPSARAGTATTTAVSYMTPGTGTTTTPVYDSWGVDGTNQINTGNNYYTNSAVLALQVNASSTATNFNIAFEYSNGTNCGTTPAACDWYADVLFATASTSPGVSLNTTRTYSWLFASSTVGGAGGGSGGLQGINGTNNRATRVLSITAIPMRYVRAVITVTGANGALVQADIMPVKETK